MDEGAQPDPDAAVTPGARPAESFSTPTGDDTEDKKGEVRHQRLGQGLRRLRPFLIVIGIGVVAALLLRAYVVTPYYVPSASMEPTLHGCSGCNNDHVLVEKLSYRFHEVQAGDVVVFHRPDTWPASQVPEDTLIKRVIGVAGDRITIKNGRVFRNGQTLSEPYVNQNCHPATTPDPEHPEIRAKTFGIVPNDEVFVMGDNRCDSLDSRRLGAVPTDQVIGRAFMIIWPVGRLHSL